MAARKQAQADTASISAAIKILVWGRFSPFEYEGPALHGFRAALCLSGLPFRAAERRASIIVTEALRRIGARRPSWNEGQPEWTAPGYSPVEYWYCQNCGRRMDEPSAAKYCSALCRAAESMHRWHSTRRRELAAAQAARRAALKAAQPPKPCEACGRTFQPAKPAARFCSTPCRNRNNRKSWVT